MDPPTPTHDGDAPPAAAARRRSLTFDPILEDEVEVGGALLPGIDISTTEGRTRVRADRGPAHTPRVAADRRMSLSQSSIRTADPSDADCLKRKLMGKRPYSVADVADLLRREHRVVEQILYSLVSAGREDTLHRTLRHYGVRESRGMSLTEGASVLQVSDALVRFTTDCLRFCGAPANSDTLSDIILAAMVRRFDLHSVLRACGQPPRRRSKGTVRDRARRPSVRWVSLTAAACDVGEGYVWANDALRPGEIGEVVGMDGDDPVVRGPRGQHEVYCADDLQAVPTQAVLDAAPEAAPAAAGQRLRPPTEAADALQAVPTQAVLDAAAAAAPEAAPAAARQRLPPPTEAADALLSRVRSRALRAGLRALLRYRALRRVTRRRWWLRMQWCARPRAASPTWTLASSDARVTPGGCTYRTGSMADDAFTFASSRAASCASPLPPGPGTPAPPLLRAGSGAVANPLQPPFNPLNPASRRAAAAAVATAAGCGAEMEEGSATVTATATEAEAEAEAEMEEDDSFTGTGSDRLHSPRGGGDESIPWAAPEARVDAAAGDADGGGEVPRWRVRGVAGCGTGRDAAAGRPNGDAPDGGDDAPDGGDEVPRYRVRGVGAHRDPAAGTVDQRDAGGSRGDDERIPADALGGGDDVPRWRVRGGDTHRDPAAGTADGDDDSAAAARPDDDGGVLAAAGAGPPAAEAGGGDTYCDPAAGSAGERQHGSAAAVRPGTAVVAAAGAAEAGGGDTHRDERQHGEHDSAAAAPPDDDGGVLAAAGAGPPAAEAGGGDAHRDPAAGTAAERQHGDDGSAAAARPDDDGGVLAAAGTEGGGSEPAEIAAALLREMMDAAVAAAAAPAASGSEAEAAADVAAAVLREVVDAAAAAADSSAALLQAEAEEAAVAADSTAAVDAAPLQAEAEAAPAAAAADGSSAAADASEDAALLQAEAEAAAAADDAALLQAEAEAAAAADSSAFARALVLRVALAAADASEDAALLQAEAEAAAAEDAALLRAEAEAAAAAAHAAEAEAAAAGPAAEVEEWGSCGSESAQEETEHGYAAQQPAPTSAAAAEAEGPHGRCAAEVEEWGSDGSGADGEPGPVPATPPTTAPATPRTGTPIPGTPPGAETGPHTPRTHPYRDESAGSSAATDPVDMPARDGTGGGPHAASAALQQLEQRLRRVEQIAGVDTVASGKQQHGRVAGEAGFVAAEAARLEAGAEKTAAAAACDVDTSARNSPQSGAQA